MDVRKGDHAGVAIARELGERLRIVFRLGATPATLGELGAALRPLLATLDEEQLCAAGTSRHEVRTGGKTRYMNCVMDALIVPFLTDQPAEIRSRSPLTGSVVTAHIARGAVEFAPAEAVISFGVSREISDATLAAVCPYINAFSTPSEYDQWVAATPEAITMMLSFTDAVAIARTDAVAMAREAAARARLADEARPPAEHDR